MYGIEMIERERCFFMTDETLEPTPVVETPTEPTQEVETPTDTPEKVEAVVETPEQVETPTEVEKPKQEVKEETPKEVEKPTAEPDEKAGQLDKATKELEKATETIENKNKEITTLNDTNKQLETVLEGIVKEQLSTFPKDIEKLMPQGSALEKLEWIKQAKEVGITKPTEIGKPIQTDKTKEVTRSAKKLNPTQRMSNVFRDAFSK